MAGAVRIRYVYETSFYDGRPDSTTTAVVDPPEQVDSAINHPIVRRIQQAVFRARKAVVSSMAHQNTSLDIGHQSDDDCTTSTGSVTDRMMTHQSHKQQQQQQHQRRSSVSTLQTSMCSSSGGSSDEEDSAAGEDGRLFLNRSRSLQQTHLLHSSSTSSSWLDRVGHHRGFSLHLSPKQRTRMSEAVLSPISDKSENETSQMLVTTGSTSTVTAGNLMPLAASGVHLMTTAEFCINSNPTSRRRPQSLFPAIIRTGGSAAFNSSDSGISISANSLVASHEALQQPSAHNQPTTHHVSLNNSHEFLSSSSSSSQPTEENLPFLMPKLRRAAAGIQSNGLFQPQPTMSLGPVRQLSLTLPFPPLQSLPFVAPVVAFKDLVDDTIPLEIQSWYHGSITRRDAEKRLRPAPAGSFLVRDSMASHDDYFLAARGENGFLHVRIDCHRIDDYSAPRDFTLATLPDRHFESVAEAVNHCANIGVYCRHLPPIILKYPLAEELV